MLRFAIHISLFLYHANHHDFVKHVRFSPVPGSMSNYGCLKLSLILLSRFSQLSLALGLPDVLGLALSDVARASNQRI